MNETKADDVLLAARGVSKDFGGLRALNKVDISVKRGTITTLIGPNGAGKTTFLNIVSGTHQPSEGSVFLREKRIDGLSRHDIAALGIVRTFQLTKLFSEMTVLENVMVGTHHWARRGTLPRTLVNARSVRAEESEVRHYALEMLRLTDMEKLAYKRAFDLPHGQQRLLELSRAIAARPQLVLLDEPAAGLNPAEEDRLQGILKAIVARGTTIFLIEHHMRLVMNISDEVHVLDVGSKIAEGTPKEIGSNPAVVRAYLGKEY